MKPALFRRLSFSGYLQLLFIMSMLLMNSCQNKTKNSNLFKTKHGWKEYAVNEQGDSVLIIYNSMKKITSKVSFKNGLFDGVGYNYYNNGNVKNEIHYKEGHKDGIAKWYYESGKPYRFTMYKNGIKDGIRKVFYKDGKLKAEIPFKDNEPQPGLKEYKKDGTLFTDQPKIHFREINRLAYENKYYLDVYCKPKRKKVEYYRIKKIDGKEYEIALPEGTEKGVARITYLVRPGDVLMKKLKIKAIVRTRHGNPLVLYKTYNLAVENRF